MLKCPNCKTNVDFDVMEWRGGQRVLIGCVECCYMWYSRSAEALAAAEYVADRELFHVPDRPAPPDQEVGCTNG